MISRRFEIRIRNPASPMIFGEAGFFYFEVIYAMISFETSSKVS